MIFKKLNKNGQMGYLLELIYSFHNRCGSIQLDTPDKYPVCVGAIEYIRRWFFQGNKTDFNECIQLIRRNFISGYSAQWLRKVINLNLSCGQIMVNATKKKHKKPRGWTVRRYSDFNIRGRRATILLNRPMRNSWISINICKEKIVGWGGFKAT